MNNTIKSTFSLLALISPAGITLAQGMKMGEVIVINTSALKKDVKLDALKAFITDIVPVMNKDSPWISMNLFQADRGEKKGEFLFVCTGSKLAVIKTPPGGSPFTKKNLQKRDDKSTKLSDFLSNPDSYTEYSLIGAEKFKSLPVAGILGIHYIKVKPDRSAAFDKFVIEKLHPAVGQLLPDLNLLYYKAVSGENVGSYITIFAIESLAARDKYWPTGAPETELLSQAFRPLHGIAEELCSYLVEGSYLALGAGAAAYFESNNWTDFIHQSFLR